VLTYLAENLRSNIRQIEGTIKKIAAKCFLVDGRQITLELAKNCVEELVGDAEPLNVTIDKVFSAVFKNTTFQRKRSSVKSATRRSCAPVTSRST